MNVSRYTARKPVHELMQEGKSMILHRALGPWNLIALGIGAIIGSGPGPGLLNGLRFVPSIDPQARQNRASKEPQFDPSLRLGLFGLQLSLAEWQHDNSDTALPMVADVVGPTGGG